MVARQTGMEKPQKLVLFIEGSSNTSNGVLAQGFRKLLAQKLKGKMPQIIMSDGKDQAIRKFSNSKGQVSGNLLIDLDGPESVRNRHLKEKLLTNDSDSVFFMVQEMEAWFISQPNILDDYYKEKISEKLPSKPAAEFSQPAFELQKLTKNTKKGKYHKVQHGTALLSMLNAEKLAEEFPDF